ncbi:MAG: selenocysteine-specific translation elongation factor [Gammaproteobacteria bacterium]|nr:selenocysteine-specific translation elongation factor [Gammaproteobacteria bacterium]
MIVATAGHVDHGKTLLVKMLTGMDTDRLEEEKRRGLSINLGFAYRKTDDNKTTVFVDVPGHNRFINNMIAGINGINLGMLVVAADDGPMPQTREHVDVLRLLGVKRFVLVISKIDRVNKAQIVLARESALTLFPEAEKVPVFEVDTPAEKGIAELAKYLEKEENKPIEKSSSGYFSLSIDRAFLIKGSGLVVTGTVASGTVNVGDSPMLIPRNTPLRIRSIQIQEQQAERAICGQRCALNITGDIEKDDIERGDWLLDSKIAQSTTRFDCRITLLNHASFTLKHMSPIKLYIGAKRVPARLALLGEKTLSSGQTCYAQMILKSEVHCCYGDRFLLRDDSESETLGGGVVIDPHALSKNRATKLRINLLSAMEQEEAGQVLETLLFQHNQIVNMSQIFLSRNIREEEATALLVPLLNGNKVTIIEIQSSKHIVANDNLNSIVEWVKKELTKEKQKEKLKSKFNKHFSGIDADLIFEFMQSEGSINVGKDSIALVQQQVLSEQQQSLWAAVESHLNKCGLNIPVIADMANALKIEQNSIKELITLAIKSKWLVLVSKNRLVLAAHIKQLSEVALSLAERQKSFSVAEYKNECGIGRNLAVEVLEYFDKIGFTLRKESGRVILHKDRVSNLFS